MEIPKWLQSSQDEQKLALTVKGVLYGVVPVILFVSNVRGWHLTQSSLDNAIDGLLTVLAALGALVSVTITFIGAARKVINEFFIVSTPSATEVMENKGTPSVPVVAPEVPPAPPTSTITQ